jgi:hypothetical protein
MMIDVQMLQSRFPQRAQKNLWKPLCFFRRSGVSTTLALAAPSAP